MDFFFDNIAFIAFGIYAFVIVIAKLGGKTEEVEEQTETRRPPTKARPHKHPVATQKRANVFREISPQPRKKYATEILESVVETPIVETFIAPIPESVSENCEAKSEEKILSPREKFSDIFSDKHSLRRAFVASEILGKPKALRRQNEGSIW